MVPQIGQQKPWGVKGIAQSSSTSTQLAKEHIFKFKQKKSETLKFLIIFKINELN